MVAGILFTLASIVISETGKIFIANILFLCGDIVYLSVVAIKAIW
jgi:hypothetical protein